MKDKIYSYLLQLGDNAMILGHRLSELCGHGPNLETDIALTNISLDLFGQVRNYFQYAAELVGEGASEDSVAFLRKEREYRNCLMTEQPNKDFAHVIVRQFLFDAYHLPLLEQLCESNDQQIAAIATKSIKEVKYHLRFSSQWMKRLGAGTEESHSRMDAALQHMWGYVDELFDASEVEQEMLSFGIGADLDAVRAHFDATVAEVCGEAGMTVPDMPSAQRGGKRGVHSEHMGYIVADLQYMQRAYPNMTW